MPPFELLNKLKFNWSSTYYESDQFSTDFNYSNYEIKPLEFLQYAESENLEEDRKSLINALTNSKRAIDCQTDTILNCFGFDPSRKFESVINDFIDEYQSKHGKFDTTQKLKLLQSLDIVPTSLVTDMRLVRNKLEHYYKVPEIKTVKNIIDLSKLFIRSTSFVLQSFPETYGLVDSKYLGKNTKEIFVSYNPELFKFNLSFRTKEKDNKMNNRFTRYNEIGNIDVYNTDFVYLQLIKLGITISINSMVESSLRSFVTTLDSRIPDSRIKYCGVCYS